MKYAGMPFGMWALFAGSFQKQLTAVLGYPKTKEGWDELGKRVTTAHANYVIEKIDRLNCPTWQKLELLQAVIDTTKGTYKPKEHQKPGWQPNR